ncbi:MAG: class I SAM-dependent methyltransferase [Gaiellales bacterium]
MYDLDDDLNDAALIRAEYGSAERLGRRMCVYRDAAEGQNPEERVLAAVPGRRPLRALDVGCGEGALAARMAADGIVVRAVDLSPAMVELAAARGVDALVASVESLPFDDATFDCVVAAWMLYHAPDLELALAEITRVLAPGGRFVAATLSDDNMAELWDALGVPAAAPLAFSTENGQAVLEPWFDSVERDVVAGRVLFDDPSELRAYIASTIRRGRFVDRVSADTCPVHTYSRHAVFTCERSR